jgi:hypothetical protein
MEEPKMTDNLALGPDAQANNALAVLRAATLEGEIGHDLPLADGIWLRIDPAAQISGRYASPPGILADLDILVEARGGWAGLHVALGGQDFAGRGLVGIACRTEAGGMDLVRPCLRSATEEGFQDSFFPKHLLSRPESALHLDAIELARHPEIPPQAAWRELILFLPTHRLKWILTDLRLFIL